MPPSNSCQPGSLSDLQSHWPFSPLLPHAMEELLDPPTVKTLPDPTAELSAHHQHKLAASEPAQSSHQQVTFPSLDIPIPNEAFLLTSRRAMTATQRRHSAFKECSISAPEHLLWHADANSFSFLHYKWCFSSLQSTRIGTWLRPHSVVSCSSSSQTSHRMLC